MPGTCWCPSSGSGQGLQLPMGSRAVPRDGLSLLPPLQRGSSPPPARSQSCSGAGKWLSARGGCTVPGEQRLPGQREREGRAPGLGWLETPRCCFGSNRWVRCECAGRCLWFTLPSASGEGEGPEQL